MKIVPYISMCILFLALSIGASNQDSRNMASASGEAFLVRAVYVDSEGVKWFGTNRGLCRYDNLTWRYYTDADFLVGNQVNAITFEMTGLGSELWVATTEGVSELVYDMNGITGSTGYTTDDGLLDNNVSDIDIDSYHGKFFGSALGVTWFHDGVMDSLTYEKYPESMVNAPVRQMDIFGDTLYLAQDGGIGRFVSGVDGVTGVTRWTSEYGITPYSDDIKSVKVDATSNQWFGTEVGVEKHIDYKAKQNWSLYSSEDGLVHNEVISITEDQSGGLWFGTLGGTSYFKDGEWTSYTTADGLLNDTVYDVDFDLDGSVWFATGAGACRLLNGEFTDFYTAVPSRIANSLGMKIFYSQATGSIHLSYILDESDPMLARLYSINGTMVGQWNDLPGTAGEHYLELPLGGYSMGGPMEGMYVLQMVH